MTQQRFVFHRVQEIPAAYWSWRDGDQVVRVYVGAHCPLDHLAWWHPWTPWR